MNFENLISKKNLLLAWRRITSSHDARYKAFFRHILEAYELSFDKNIDDLRRRLKNGEYFPQTPLRFYVPKSSGLQRPLTLLSIEDQIVLQALTNLFAEKVRERRSKLSGKYVYSNKLGQKDSQFFLERWQPGFSQLKRNLKSKFEEGYTWIAIFDISAFYDTIPHEILLKVLIPHSSGALYNVAQKWLKTWSSDNHSDEHNHGIPQGPMASDFLAECTLLSIDEKMSQRYMYFRYVDDIRILGKSELEVRKALVYLDVLCKNRGLIPNSNKTKIRQAKSAIDLVEDIPEITRYFEDGNEKSLSKKSAEKSIEDAIVQKEKLEVKDRTLLRFALFRAPASDTVLKTVLGLWEHYPEHTDAYVAFLENYQRSDSVVMLANRLLQIDFPYDFVQGELWKLLARMGNISELVSLKELAIETVRSKVAGCASRIGAQIFLSKCNEVGLGNYQKWLMYEKRALVQAFVTPYINLNSNGGILTGKSILSRSLIDPHLGLIKPLINSNLRIDIFGNNPSDFPFVTQYSYKSAGLTGHNVPKPDAVGNLISKRYAVKKWNKWQGILQGEYEHAHMELRFADLYFDSHLSSWLNYQDAFNEIVFRAFQDFLAKKGAPGTIAHFKPNGERIDYGHLLGNPIFKSAYCDLQDDLHKVHKRRNSVPSTHPYDKKTGNKARPLKKSEQKTLKLYLDDAFNQIIKITEALGI